MVGRRGELGIARPISGDRVEEALHAVPAVLIESKNASTEQDQEEGGKALGA